MTRTLFAGALLALTLSAPVAAEEPADAAPAKPRPARVAQPSYDWIEANYAFGHFGGDDVRITSDQAYNVAFNAKVAPHFFLLADYGSQDFGAFDLDVTTYDVGVGGYVALVPGTHGFVTVVWQKLELDSSGDSTDEDGFGYEIGLRKALAGRSEFALSYRRSELEGEDSGFSFEDAFNEYRAALTAPLGAALDVTFRIEHKKGAMDANDPDTLLGDAEFEQYSVGLRYRF